MTSPGCRPLRVPRSCPRCARRRPRLRRSCATLRAGGAVLAGKTHLFEFAWGLTGRERPLRRLRAPQFPGRTSGGSSSGSAAAVAADVVPFAIGTDTGGSIRVPAAFCGIFGYRGVPARSTGSPTPSPSGPELRHRGLVHPDAPGDMSAALAALVGLRTSERGPARMLPRDARPRSRGGGGVRAPPRGSSQPADVLRPGTSFCDKFASAPRSTGSSQASRRWKIHKKWAERYRNRYGPLVRDRLDRARAISQAQVAAVEPSHEALKRRLDASSSWPTISWSCRPRRSRRSPRRTAPMPTGCGMLGLTAPASLAAFPSLTIPGAAALRDCRRGCRLSSTIRRARSSPGRSTAGAQSSA